MSLRSTLGMFAVAAMMATPVSAVFADPPAIPLDEHEKPAFTVHKTSFGAGDTIHVKYVGSISPPPGQSYWITIVKASEPDSEWGTWHYVTAGATSDELKPPGTGDYEIRLHDLYPKHSYKVISRTRVVVGGTVAPAIPDCAATFKEIPGHEKFSGYSCRCAGAGSGSVWGTHIYTRDSNVCRAAVHAGAITSAGGVVSVTAADGCSAYTGTTHHEITTSSWGAYAGSFYFPGYGSGTCGGGEKQGATITACPSNFKGISGSITCTCGETTGGAVWGTDTYTTDSSICAAARHSGAIGKDGGTVTATATAGCSKYVGTVEHGITSSAWGA